jgi:hydroxymethylbilane synthase
VNSATRNPQSAIIRIGTRKSPLALVQSKLVKAELVRHHPDLAVSLVPITTKGDRVQDRSLVAPSGTGIFTKAIEEKLLAEEVDLAVHSLKDLPTALPAGLALGAILPREDPADVLVSRRFARLEELPVGARVGTGSPRRRAQMLHLRPDLDIREIRGNVETRLAKIDRGEYDAALLARAGLTRLGITGWTLVSIPQILPAPGQGAIAVEIRADDGKLAGLLKPLHHEPTALAVRAERMLLAALGGGCHMPLGTLASAKAGRLTLRAVLFEPDGSNRREGCAEGRTDEIPEIVESVKRQLGRV